MPVLSFGSWDRGGLVMFLCSTEAFLRPDLSSADAPRTAAVKAGRRCAGAASSIVARPRLVGGEHGAKLAGRDEWSRDERGNVILDWAVNDECGSTASPCIRSGVRSRYPDLSCTGESKAQKRRDPSEGAGSVVPWLTTVTRLSWFTSAVIARGRLQARTQHGAGGHHAGLEITPQRNHELARERHDGDPARPTLEVAHPLMEPAGQFAAGLVSDPQPGELDGELAGAAVAGFADALIRRGGATVVGRPTQPDMAADLAAIVEVAIEHFIDQPLSAHHGDAFELGEHHGLGLPRAFLRGPQLGPALAFDRLQLPVQQAKPLVLAHDLLLQLLRQWPPVTGAQVLEALDEARLHRHDVADALGMQQSLDPIGVRRALIDQVVALPVSTLAVLILHRWRGHHAAHPRLSPQIGQQRAHQMFQVDAIGLGSPHAAAHLDARRLALEIDHPLGRQPTMQPVPVETGLVARHDANRLAAASSLR